mgnify:CR=1 FL=1
MTPINLVVFQISTHTLTWSVTLQILLLFYLPYHFNSHAHVERDVPLGTAMFIPRYFNSHAHVERDFLFWNAIFKIKDFNSHAHVERDDSTKLLVEKLRQFQLTRSRGA